MPTQVTKFKIFVSAPSNLTAERLIVEKVFEDLGKDFTEKNISFEVFLWETSAVPGIGVDPQSVISSQLDYDIFIGLLGTVFGTPTAPAGSGTEEEFQEAYQKYQECPESVRVLFYFKKSAENIFDIQPDELKKVHVFRKELGSLGVLYHDFADLDQLRTDIRAHISSLISKQWSGSTWRILSPPKEEKTFSSAMQKVAVNEPELLNIDESHFEQESDERDGLFEVIIQGVSTGDLFRKHMERVSGLSRSVTAALVDAGKSIEDASTRKDIEQTKEAIDNSSRTLDAYTAGMKAELSVYKDVSGSTILVLESIANLYFEEKTGSLDEVISLATVFEELTHTLRDVRTSLQKFRDIVEKTPSLTMNFRAARKRLTFVLDEYISSYTVFIGTSGALIDDVRRRISNAGT